LSWRPQTVFDSYFLRTGNVTQYEPVTPLPDNFFNSRNVNSPLVTYAVQIPLRNNVDFDLPQNLLGTRSRNTPIPQLKPPGTTNVKVFDLPQNLLGSRNLGIRLVTFPDRKTYAKEFTLAQTHLRETRGGLNFLLWELVTEEPPWWNPLPDARNKWVLFDAERKWPITANRKYVTTTRVGP
jgi:hypothetical protein